MEKKTKILTNKKIAISIIVAIICVALIGTVIYLVSEKQGKIYPTIYKKEVIQSATIKNSEGTQMYDNQSGYYIEQDIDLLDISKSLTDLQKTINSYNKKYSDLPITAIKYNLILDGFNEMTEEETTKLINSLKNFENTILSYNYSNLKKGVIIEFKYKTNKKIKDIKNQILTIVSFAQKNSNLYIYKKLYNKYLVFIKGPNIKNLESFDKEEQKEILKIYTQGLSFSNNIILEDYQIKILEKDTLPNIGRSFLLNGEKQAIANKDKYIRASYTFNEASIKLEKNTTREYHIFQILRSLYNTSTSIINLTESEEAINIIKDLKFSNIRYTKENIVLYDQFYKKNGYDIQVKDVIKQFLGSSYVIDNYYNSIDKEKNTAVISFGLLNFGTSSNFSVKELTLKYKKFYKNENKYVDDEILLTSINNVSIEELTSYKTLKYVVNLKDINTESLSELKLVITYKNGKTTEFKSLK